MEPMTFTRVLSGPSMPTPARTIAFSRRFAPYKRANLLLQDVTRLSALLSSSKRPVQLLFAGKSHPADQPGKEIVAKIVAFAREQPRVVFLKDYDIELARHLVQGADVWLNNAIRQWLARGECDMHLDDDHLDGLRERTWNALTNRGCWDGVAAVAWALVYRVQLAPAEVERLFWSAVAAHQRSEAERPSVAENAA